jgi:hypothetical protein
MIPKSSNNTKQLIIAFFGIFYCSITYGQNIKKVYRNLAKDKIEKVSEEMVKFEDETTSTLDTKLWEIALAIVVNHNTFEKYDPYQALSYLNDVKIYGSLEKEVREFLSDYDLSINSIRTDIYRNILQVSKKINKEESYKKALSVCENCFYLEEAKKLKELAAYNETISLGSLTAYKRYLNKYPIGAHNEEILSLLTKMEFENAVNANSISKLEGFLEKYPSSIFHTKVLFHRDSLILDQMQPSYDNYKAFLKTYPSSHFNQTVKEKLPDLLYDETIKNNTISGYRKFLIELPEDKKIDEILKLLKRALVNSIRSLPTLPEIREFKNHFPESPELDWIVKTSDSLIENSDWKRQNLNGEVKEISFDFLNHGNDNNSLRGLIKKFDPSGRMIFLEYEESKLDMLYKIEHEINPIEFDHETQIFTNFGLLNPPYELRAEIKEMTDDNGKKYVLKYNSGGLHKVFRVENESNSGKQYGKDIFEFKYNQQGNLIERIGESYDVSYTWNEGKMISKKIYNKNEKFLGEYEIDYPGNELQISLKSTGSNQLDISYKSDPKGRIIERKMQKIKESYSVPVRSYNVSNFEYDPNKRVISVTSIEFALNFDETLYYPERKDEIKLRRDGNGNIVSYSKIVQSDQNGELQVNEHYSEEMEWEYTYDKKGNWISRKEYYIQDGSRNLANKVVRDIEYHTTGTDITGVSYTKAY